MILKKILLIPHGDGLNQPAVRRLLEVAGADAEVEIFDPTYNSHLEAYPVDENESYLRLRDHLVQERLDRAGALAKQLTAHGVTCTAMAAWGLSAVRRDCPASIDYGR